MRSSARTKIAAGGGQPRGAVPGGVGVALNLAERDGRLGDLAIVMEDRVPRVLPPLLNQTRFAAAGVFNEAVAIDVAMFVHPLERREDVGPQPIDQAGVARAIEV